MRRAWFVTAFILCVLGVGWGVFLSFSDTRDVSHLALCQGGEQGYWRIQMSPDRERAALIVSREDDDMPGHYLCIVGEKQKIEALALMPGSEL